MVDEAKQEDNFEPTPYKHSNRKELDETEMINITSKNFENLFFS